MPGKKTLIAGFVVLVVIVVLVIGAVFVYPMLTSGNSAGASDTTGSSGSTASTSSSGSTTGVLTNTGVASITVKETTAPNIPTTGVWVYISYIGGWTGSYGMPSDLQKVTSSGIQLEEVLNATGTIQASFTKQDNSKHTLTVEIYKEGKLLASGNTSNASGKVTVSADVGTAASGASSTTTPAKAGNTTTAKTTAVVTTAKTTAPAASTT